MPVFPYKVRPVPPLLAVLLDDGEQALCEDGKVRPLAELPPGFRVWGSWELVGELWGDGMGEALCWQGRPVRWRSVKHAGERRWKNRHTDVRVLRLSFPEEPEKALAGFVAWRGWLAGHGATPAGSLGSSAFSLLRATLRAPLWTSLGWAECGTPVPYPLGGRQELVRGPGAFEPAQHYDLPAAYANELGGMRYGGHWVRVGPNYPYGPVARRGLLCFIRARVRVPALQYGPLPRRPRGKPKQTDALWSIFPRHRYPVDTVITGTWTWDELEAASEAGCKVRVLDVYLHTVENGKLPFKPWWETVQLGRALGGFAGQLGKATGNALWGQFCITPDAARTVRSWSGSRRNPREHKRAEPLNGATPHYAPDLAETLTGRVRAALYRCMAQAGTPLVCAHTDGIWTEGEVPALPRAWRAKEKVARLEVVNPQVMRYYRALPPRAHNTEYVVAGAPDTLAPAVFNHIWNSLRETGQVM